MSERTTAAVPENPAVQHPSRRESPRATIGTSIVAQSGTLRRLQRSAGGAAGLAPLVRHVQGRAGNRAVGELLGPISGVGAQGHRTVQRDDLREGGGGTKVGGGEQFEISWVLKEHRWGIKTTFKATFALRGSKVVESPTVGGPVVGGDVTGSLVENKAQLEKSSKGLGRKITSTLARGDWSSGPLFGIPGLTFVMTAKAGEAKFDLKNGEVGLDALKISGNVVGDFAIFLDNAGLANMRDRVSVKGSLQVEKAISVQDLARLRAAIRAKDELANAAKDAEKHADEYAKHRKDLMKHQRQRKGLETRVTRSRARVDAATKRLESARGHRLTAHGPEAKRLEKQLLHAQTQLQHAETALAKNRQAAKESGRLVGKAAKGLADAGKRLKQAGQKLDAAVKKVSDKLAGPVKKALEATTKKIMKKLAGTLIAKGLAYLVPGLNLLMTAIDLGSVLFKIFGDSEGGVVGGDGDGDEAGTGAGGEGPKGEGGTGGEGEAGAEGGGSSGGDGTGTGGESTKGGGEPVTTPDDPGRTKGTGDTSVGTTPPPKAELSATAKQLLEAFNGDPLSLDEEAVRYINEGVPKDITADELDKLIDGLENAAGETADPYELVVEIQAQLAAIRAGEATITTDPGKAEEKTELAPKEEEIKVEAPKTLVPFTRSEAMDMLQYERTKKEFVLKAAYQSYKSADIPPHPDGLKVKINDFKITTDQPSAGKGHLLVKLAIELEVLTLPANAANDYPYKVGQTKTEKMTFLFDPTATDKKKAWGELDYSHVAQLRSMLTRSGDTWELTGSNRMVQFTAATVRVDKILEQRVVTGSDGEKVHKFAVLVTPTEVRGARAGYTTSRGWVEFIVDKPVPITFELPEAAPVPATAAP